MHTPDRSLGPLRCPSVPHLGSLPPTSVTSPRAKPACGSMAATTTSAPAPAGPVASLGLSLRNLKTNCSSVLRPCWIDGRPTSSIGARGPCRHRVTCGGARSVRLEASMPRGMRFEKRSRAGRTARRSGPARRGWSWRVGGATNHHGLPRSSLARHRPVPRHTQGSCTG